MNRLMKALNLRYPIIQGPFGGASTVELVSAVCNRGGLGSYGGHYETPSELANIIARIRACTQRAFNINLWVSHTDVTEHSSMSIAIPLGFESQVEVAIDCRVPVLSFTFGIPDQAVLEACRKRGIFTIGVATTADEARQIEACGINAVVASGTGAGGHRPAFMAPPEQNQIGTMSLVSEVCEAVTVPVIAAGGIVNGRGIHAALALGAECAQLGTVFLACEESGLPTYKRDYLFANKHKTMLTRLYTGRLCRYIENHYIREHQSAPTLPYPLQAEKMTAIRRAAEAQQDMSTASISCGEGINLIRHRRVGTLLNSIVGEFNESVGSIMTNHDHGCE